MYSSYFYNNGATVANILNDLKLILTGTTDVNTLSSQSCNKAQTLINASVTTSAWVAHDITGVAANWICLKAPLSDDGTHYKYMVLDMNTMAGQVGSIITKFYDKWVNGLTWARSGLVATVTHASHGYISGMAIAVTVTSDVLAITLGAKTITVIDQNTYTFACLNAGALSGTLTMTENMAYWSDNTIYSQRWPTTVAVAPNLVASMMGRIDISASTRHCVFYSFQNGVYGSSTNLGPSGIMERTRRSPWDTVGNGQLRGYLPAVWGNLGIIATATAPFYANILPNAAGIDQFGGPVGTTNLAAYIITPFGSNTGPGSTALHTTPSSIVPNSVIIPQHLLIPFGCMQPSFGFLGGDISSVCDIWLTTYSYGGAFDELTIGSDTYVIWMAGPSSTYRIAVRKG
jgi:hypothetical protein